MPRKGLVTRRAQASDPVYDSQLVDKFICSMMWEGKKSTAQRAFYGAMDQVAKKTNDNALKIFKNAACRGAELPGSRGSKSFSAAIAGHSVVVAVFAGTFWQDHDRQIG